MLLPAVTPCFAVIEPISPGSGEMVTLVPDAQKKAMSLPTLDERHELEADWESTFYPRIPDANPDPHFWCRESHFNNGFSKYGKEGDSWNRRIELYLLDCGVTQDEIKAFRSIMLE